METSHLVQEEVMIEEMNEDGTGDKFGGTRELEAWPPVISLYLTLLCIPSSSVGCGDLLNDR